MAEDAEFFRKQIAFLSNLISSHKTAPKPKQKPVLKNQVGLENSRQNKNWTRWKTQAVVNRNEIHSTSHDGRPHQGSRIKDTRTSKTVLNCQSNHGISSPNKFTYRRKPLETSVNLARNKLDNSSKTGNIPNRKVIYTEKRKQTTNCTVSPCTSTYSSIPLTQTQVTPPPATYIKTKPLPNNYIVHNTCKPQRTILPNTASQHLSTRSQVVESPRRTTLSKVSSGHLTKQQKSSPSVSNNTHQHAPVGIPKGSKLKWRRKSLTRSSSSTLKKTKAAENVLHSQSIPKTSKLKWRRRSGSSSSVKKTRPVTNTFQSKTIPKKSKLKWRNRSAPRSSSSVFKKTQPVEIALQTKTIPKTSKLKWKRKSVTGSSSVSRKKLDTKLHEKGHSNTQLVHKSRYSFKRTNVNEERSSGMLGGYPKTSHVGYRKGIKQSFVARRTKYVAIGSHKQLNKAYLFKAPNSSIRNADSTRTVKIRGMNYIIGSHGKSLHRTENAKHNKTTLSNVVCKPGQLRPILNSRKSTSKHVFNRAGNRSLKRQISLDKHKNEMANKILRRSLQNVQASIKKDNRQKLKSEQYCMFYNKFGKCAKQKQGICPYIHDPTKIAVCTRFLRGTCQQMDGTCLFSHKIDKAKMPICQYFLKGKCTKDDCPYSHVNVGRSAVVCEDFLKGYCALGFKCKKKHVLECEEFNTTGRCPNGTKCKLIHRKKNRQQKRYFQEVTSSEEYVPKAKKVRQKSSDGFLPLEGSLLADKDECDQLEELPAHEQTTIESSVSLQIRPKFTTKTNSDGYIHLRNETSSSPTD